MHLGRDSGWFVVVIAVDIMVNIFLLRGIGVSGRQMRGGEKNLRRSEAHDKRLQRR